MKTSTFTKFARPLHALILCSSAMALSACGDAPADASAAPTESQAATGGGGGGGGGLGPEVTYTNNIFINSQPQRGQAVIATAVDTRFAPPIQLTATLVGHGGAPPPDTFASFNGIRLLADGAGRFHLDPFGVQPTIAPDNQLHLFVSAPSLGSTVNKAVPCPAVAALTTTPAAGSSIGATKTVTLSWGNLNNLGGLDPRYGEVVFMWALDAVTGLPTGTSTNVQIPRVNGALAATGGSIAVPPSSGGYRVDLVLNGFVTACNRVQSLTYLP